MRKRKKRWNLKKNEEFFEKFREKLIEEGVKEIRIRKYFYTLRSISKMLKKEFDKVSREDIGKLIRNIENSNFSPHTKHDYKVVIKRFYNFLSEYLKRPEFKEMVSWIRTTIKEKLPLPKIITREEVLKLVQVARSVRDKAFFFVLFESGCRIGELLNLRIEDVEFDSFGAVLIVKGKTGSRRIRICGRAADYLKEWIMINHPTKNPNSRVFPYTYENLLKVLKTAVKRANIKKNVHFHMFRHGRATELATHLTEQELDIFFGWEIGSRMPRTYVHLSGRDIERKILEISGVTMTKKIDEALKRIKVKDPELFQRLLDFVVNELKIMEKESL